MFFKSLFLSSCFFFFSFHAFAKPQFFNKACFNKDLQFIENYFSGEARYSDINNFFSCLDRAIQMFLEHTRPINPNYYSRTEIRRFWQYMGFPRVNDARRASVATLRIKKGLIGGHKDKVTLKEIKKLRKVLQALSIRLESFHPYMYLLDHLLSKTPLKRETVLRVSGKLVTNFIALGTDFSHIGINTDLNSLSYLPEDLRVFNLNISTPHYWKNIINLTKQWKFIFSGPPDDIIHSKQWPPLLFSVGSFFSIWFYYNQFLKGKNWMHIDSIQHTQFILSNLLNILYTSKKQFKRSSISLTDVDKLGEQIWAFPFLSSPSFKLGIRTIHCFILEPLSSNKPCNYHLEVQNEDVFINFPDSKFHIDPNKNIFFSYVKNTSSFLKIKHLSIIRTYLNSWIKSENNLRHSNTLPTLFGSLNTWKKRNIDVLYGGHLNFFSNKNINKKHLMSQLNWQSHFMHIMSKSYTLRGTPLDYDAWDLFIREWAPFSISIYEEITWKTFHQQGLKFFANADMLTSHSNGDGIIQDDELLEVFSISFSAINSLLKKLREFNSCRFKNPYYLDSQCVSKKIKTIPQTFLSNFPVLLKTQFSSLRKSNTYLSSLDQYYAKYPKISIRDLLELFIMLHNQENLIEFLDKDRSQTISSREFFPLLSNFKNTIINKVPFILTDREAFAFMNYLLKFKEIPVLNASASIHSPIYFANWIINPKNWEADYFREDILGVLVFLNSDFSLEFDQPENPFFQFSF